MSLFLTPVRFSPRLLAEVRDQILRELPEHPVREPSSRRIQGVDFDGLLRRLRETPADSVVRVGQELTVAEVDTLSYRFSDISPKDPAKRRAATVLLARWRRRFGKMAWRQFQRAFDDPELPRLINVALDKHELVPEDSSNRILSEAMSSSDPLGKMAEHVHSARGPFDDEMSSLAIVSDVPLYKELLKRYLVNAGIDVYKQREREDFLLDSWTILAAEQPETYLQVIDRYLTTFLPPEFATALMNHISRRLGRPDAEGNSRWQGVSEKAQQNYVRWLNLDVMRRFFEEAGDNERFRFWALFEDLLRDVKPVVVRDSKAAFLIFDDVVVVEFAKIGNAAYVYSRNRYERDFADYATGEKEVTYESALKDTFGSWTLTDAVISRWRSRFFHDRPEDCLRIIHSGDWQSRIYYFMRSIARQR